jgi:hypothetical protein
MQFFFGRKEIIYNFINSSLMGNFIRKNSVLLPIEKIENSLISLQALSGSELYRIGEQQYTENYYSNHEFGRADHERFAEAIKNTKSRFSISYYDFPDLSLWFPKDVYKWEKKEFVKAAAAKKGKKQNIAEELLIMNY